MSWHIKSIGPKLNVIAEVEAQETLPAALKSGIVEIIRGISDQSADMVQVETYGHSGGGYSSISKLEVLPIVSAKAPAPLAEPGATAAQVPESLKSTTTQV